MPSWKHGCFLAEYLIWYGLFDGCQHLFVSFSLAVLACFEAFAAGCPSCASFTAGTAACWAAGLRKGQPPASSLWGQRASVRLPVSETSCPKEVEVLLFQNARSSMPGAMFERAVNSGSCGFFSYSKCCILLKSATIITKGSVSYLSSPCFSTSLGGIGRQAHGIHGILLDINYKGGGPPHPENGHGFNSHGWRGHGPPH